MATKPRFFRFLIPFVVALAAFAALAGFGPTKAAVGAVFAFTVALWITELLPLGVTALVSSALLIFVAKIPEKETFAAYGDPIIPLFIGSFLLAKGMEITGLGDRFAFLILKQSWANRTPSRLLFALGIVACAISLLVSNTATTAAMLPIGLAVLGTVGARNLDRPYAIGIMLMLTWASSIAVGVPVGTPPNLIGISLIEKATGTRISFLQWMAFGIPITMLMLLACWGILWFLYGKNAPDTAPAGEAARESLREMGPMKQSERVVLMGFAVSLLLWVIPDLSEMLFTKKHLITEFLQTRIPASVAAIVGAAVLFVLPARDREGGRALSWREGSTIDWGTILLYGGGIALGQALFSSGLAKDLGELAANSSGADSLWAITALVTAAAIILSELASNTAAATTLVPVAIGLAQGANVSPIAPALGVAIGASLGFMLPVSTAPNAIVYSSGLVPSKEMLKAGLVLDVVGFVVIVLCLWAILPLLGLA
jgi:sodium-dependent dicarboxylate transporter 2/3/5